VFAVEGACFGNGNDIRGHGSAIFEQIQDPVAV
jgi:hypothetical protein